MPFVFLLIAVLVLTKLQNSIYKKTMFRNLEYRCYFSVEEAYEGDEIELIEELSNAKLLPLPWLKTDFNTSKWLDFAGSRSVISDQSRFVSSFFMCKSFHKVTRKWKVKCLKRGNFGVERVSVVASDLLGNYVGSKAFDVQAKVTVLPAPVASDELIFAEKHPMGEMMVRRHIVTDPFTIVGSREYSDGDPMNRIDWPATARTGKLMVKQNAFTADPGAAVVLNVQSREFERDQVIDAENVENAIRVCAGVFEQTLLGSTPFRFFANALVDGKEVHTAADFGMGYVQELLRTLSAIPLAASSDFAAYLAQNEEEFGDVDLIVVTSYWSEALGAWALTRGNVKFAVTGYVDPALIPEGCAVLPMFELFRK